MTLRSALLPLAIATLVACNNTDDPDVTPDPDPDPEVEMATFRVVHASADAPTVDIWVAGIDEPLFTDVAYGDTTAWIEVPADTYTVELRAAGSDGSSAAAYTQDLGLVADTEVTTIAAGSFASTESTEAFRILAFEEGWAEADSGTALVRIVHASATAPSVAIDVGNDGAPEVMDFARYADTGAAGVALPSDTSLQVGIWAGEPLERVTAFTTPALAEGETYYVIATGFLEDLPRETSGFSLLAVGDTGSVGFIAQNPTVYAMHSSPDAPAVDIFAGEAELVDDLAFGELSAPIQVPPGSYTLDFHGHTQGSVAPRRRPRRRRGDARARAGPALPRHRHRLPR